MSNVSEHLQNVLADTYSVYLKTHSFHWNVEGLHFNTLHTMFEEQYTDMWTAIDEIAERIRALDDYAPKSYSDMARITSIAEETAIPGAIDMVRQLVKDNETLVATLNKAFQIADEAGDDATADMIIARIQIHEKSIWMMKSLLK